MRRAERAARALEGSGLGALLRRVGRWRGVLVLNYHRIGDPRAADGDPDVFSATADELDAQVELLGRCCELVEPEAVALARRRTGRRVLLTFDDGYRCAHDAVLPILRRHGVPAAFFVVTGFVGGGGVAWWDEVAWMARRAVARELPAGRWLDRPVPLGDPGRATAALAAAYKRLPAEETGAFLDHIGAASGAGRRPAGEGGPWLDWDQVRALRAAGMAVGGHSATHPVLARLDRDGQRREIDACAAALERETGERMRIFSYPVGLRDSFDETTRALLRDRGVELAFSFYGGLAGAHGWDPLDVPRVPVFHRDSAARFRARAAAPRIFAGL